MLFFWFLGWFVVVVCRLSSVVHSLYHCCLCYSYLPLHIKLLSKVSDIAYVVTMTTITTPATTPNAATTATSNTNDDGINDNKAGGEEDPMAAFDRILKSPSRHQERQRNDYLKRLTSFSTAGMAYFAKPASISPLVCARFG